MNIQHSEREMFRNDFDDGFLWDFEMFSEHEGYDPRNHIGLECGINLPRILDIQHEKPVLLGIRRQAE